MTSLMTNKLMKFSPKQALHIYKPFKQNVLEVHEGGVRSGKTVTLHFRYALYLINCEDTNHLIVAYNQEQAYRLMIDGDGTGLLHIFGKNCTLKSDRKLGDYLEVMTPKGVKRVFYKGGAMSNSVGAITGMSLGSVVFCEINLLHMNMIQECFRRTFASKHRFHIADLNPPAPQHPVISEVFNVQNTDWTHWTIHDNPIITEDRKKEIEQVLIKSPYLYKRDWLGLRVLPQGVIYALFDRDKHIKQSLDGLPVEMYFTGDGGNSDATSVSCNIVVNSNNGYKVYRVANYYHSGSRTGEVKAMSTYALEIKDFIAWCIEKFKLRYSYIFIDPACKSLREELHKLGLQTYGADNDLETGIERGQTLMADDKLFLLETDRYDHYDFEREISLYVRNDSGYPVDKDNHSLDEFRYSNNYFYKKYYKAVI